MTVTALRMAPSPVAEPDRLVVVLTISQFRLLIQEAVESVLDDQRASPTEPALLSGSELAARLGISRASVHRLRLEGCPAIKICDSFKFEIAAVLGWLRARSRP